MALFVTIDAISQGLFCISVMRCLLSQRKDFIVVEVVLATNTSTISGIEELKFKINHDALSSAVHVERAFE